MSLAMAAANFTAFPKILAHPLAPRRVVAVAFIVTNMARQIWAAVSLKTKYEGRWEHPLNL